MTSLLAKCFSLFKFSLSECKKRSAFLPGIAGKAPGTDAIPAEIYKTGGPILIQKLTELFTSFWSKGSLPQDFKDVSIVHLYKRKGNRQACDNHRGISLLSIAGKILASVAEPPHQAPRARSVTRESVWLQRWERDS